MTYSCVTHPTEVSVFFRAPCRTVRLSLYQRAPYVEAAVGKGRDVVRGEQILIPVFPQIVVGVVAVVQDRVDEGPRLPFVADERAEYGGLERVHVHGPLRPDGQGFQQAGQFLRSAQNIPSPFLFDMRPAHEEDFLGRQQGASRRQVARRLRKIPFQGVLVRFRLPAPLTERIHVLFGQARGRCPARPRNRARA